MKILITGGAGFIGSHLTDYLLAKESNIIVCVDNLSNGREANLREAKLNKRFKFYNFDLTDEIMLNKLFKNNSFDLVYHLAANSDIQAGASNIEVDLKHTFLTTFYVLSSMKKYSVGKIIFASSSAIYGELEETLVEDSGPLLPISNYGAAKLSSEAYISAFCTNYNIKAWIVRFPNVIGWRLTHGVIYDFLNKLEKDPSELCVLGNGKQQKPYLYVDDLLSAIDCIYEKTQNKVNYFNVAANSDTTVTEIAKIIISKLNLTGTKVVFTGGDRGWIGDVPKFKYDISKIKSINWKPKYTSNQAVELSVEKEIYYRKNNL